MDPSFVGPYSVVLDSPSVLTLVGKKGSFHLSQDYPLPQMPVDLGLHSIHWSPGWTYHLAPGVWSRRVGVSDGHLDHETREE